MASSVRAKRKHVVDYQQLNSLSTVVLYDTVPKRNKGRLWEVERVISRRTVRHVSLSCFVFILVNIAVMI